MRFFVGEYWCKLVRKCSRIVETPLKQFVPCLLCVFSTTEVLKTFSNLKKTPHDMSCWQMSNARTDTNKRRNRKAEGHLIWHCEWCYFSLFGFQEKNASGHLSEKKSTLNTLVLTGPVCSWMIQILNIPMLSLVCGFSLFLVRSMITLSKCSVIVAAKVSTDLPAWGILDFCVLIPSFVHIEEFGEYSA